MMEATKTVQGALVKSPGVKFGERVFYINKGKRHWVQHADWMSSNGFNWPDDVSEIPEEVMLQFLPGRSFPSKQWDDKAWKKPPRNSSLVMREISASRLKGSGVEFGAGANPYPIPEHCQVLYADLLTAEQLEKELYPGQDCADLIKPDLQSDFDSFRGVEDESMDFIIGCHVIEHTTSPISVIETAYRKLRKGGSLVLVIPDKKKTFDKNRELTTLEHLVLDHEHPDRERDYEHYIDFYTVGTAYNVPESELEKTIKENYDNYFAIHYHVWTYETFSKMIDYIQKNVCQWSEVWSQPTLNHAEYDIEFYFVLTK
ncbi:class I SAM-dependent methyltransferase [Gimesia sp.]|uniref:class I SAM-dependent methyltransferase n=1 Tax=Gimesia sp. TaxID=2024833 RepID=UPI003A95C80F